MLLQPLPPHPIRLQHPQLCISWVCIAPGRHLPAWEPQTCRFWAAPQSLPCCWSRRGDSSSCCSLCPSHLSPQGHGELCIAFSFLSPGSCRGWKCFVLCSEQCLPWGCPRCCSLPGICHAPGSFSSGSFLWVLSCL